MRIVSVVPSLTELLFDLGLESQLVGITKFCIHPKEKTKKIKKIGGTKNLKIDTIIDLNPDIIIANKEENQKEDILELQKHFKVIITEMYNLEDTYSAIKTIGKNTNTFVSANKLVQQIQDQFSNLIVPDFLINKKIAYIIWNNPIMVAGQHTFINHLIEKIKAVNIISSPTSRYPEVEISELQKLNPDYIFLSSEPFPFKEKHLIEFKENFKHSKIILVDGEMFSWYGSRLKYAPAYFMKLFIELTN